MNTKHFLYLIIALLYSTLSIGQNQDKTLGDYQRAAGMMSPKLTELLDHVVSPEWLPDGRLFYSVENDTVTTYYLFDAKKKKLIQSKSKTDLLQGIKQMDSPWANYRFNEVVSPDGKRSAFIRDYNLWVKDLTSDKEVQLTTDGYKDYGYATDNAGWKHTDAPILLWSPGSDKISTFRQDQRHVHDMYLVKTKVGSPELESWKYPLPGDSAVIKIERLIIDLTDFQHPKTTFLKIPPDDHRATLMDDISVSGSFDDNAWSADEKSLAFVSSSRDHKIARLRIADAATGQVRDVMQEEVPTQYVSGQGAINWRYLSNTNEIIWYSERTDWAHLYLYDANTGKLKNPITSGNYVVTKIIKIDEKNREIYFYGQGKDPGVNPYFAYAYKVGFDGKNLTLLTPGKGDHNIDFSPDGKYYIDSYSQIDVPPTTEIRRTKDAKLISSLGQMNISRLEASGWKSPIPFTVRSANGQWDLYGLYCTPSNFNPEKKYPVVVNIYPGPQGGSVGYWGFTQRRGDLQALAELGFIVVQLEGSCNPNRSKSFQDACYGAMSTNTLPDQIAGLQQLQSRLGFLDLDKVGIWGHSGGGFATAAALLHYPDFFKVGIAESGNHDNRNYEDDWGERYIGLLDGDNYKDQANQNYAKNLKGKLLIAHGGMDDNVPPYNAYLLVDALIKANKDFDLLIFPNARHGYGADSFYMMRKRWDYFVENLQGVGHPKEFDLKAALKR